MLFMAALVLVWITEGWIAVEVVQADTRRKGVLVGEEPVGGLSYVPRLLKRTSHMEAVTVAGLPSLQLHSRAHGAGSLTMRKSVPNFIPENRKGEGGGRPEMLET